MGVVYKAEDTRLRRTVAIKVLSEERLSSPEVRQRFEREARTISSLNHPHICTLHDVGHGNQVRCRCLEVLRSADGNDCFSTRGPKEPRSCVT